MSTKARLMNPFPGLRPFRQDEDYLFFGREEQTMELLQLLGKERFVAVVGTSGSGKSSLVRCGLLSELLGGKLLKAGASWEVAVTHPGGNPLALLAESILEADLYDRNQENARENLLATLSRSHFGLVEAIKQARLGEDVNFLLVVDQFEEIFRFNEAGQQQQEAANEFVSLLLESVAQTAVPIYVVITMRSDFIGECGEFEGLAEMVNRGEFLIPRLSREQFKRVIEAPIKVAGGRITPRLLQRLLNDLGQQADQLPCLQHALMRTWSVWSERGDGDALDLEDYQRVGRMSEALSLHADEIFHSFETDRQRALCAGLFKALTVQESESRGIRRPQRLGSLCQILDVPAGELRPIIDAYRRQGVTFLMPPQEVELTERTIIDISHESLMRVWTRLRYWVEEEAQAAGIYLRLSESAALYRQGKSGLYRDPELGIALAWRETERPNAAWAERYRPGFDAAMAFLEASQQASAAEEEAREAARQRELEQARQLAEAQQLRLEQQQRAARRLRLMIAGLAAVALIAGIACVAALFANQRAITLAAVARQNEEDARQNARRAEESRQETAKALAVVAFQKREVEGSLAKAETAERLARTAEEAGRKLLYTTDMRLAPFVWKDDRTTAEQLRVLLAKHIPERPAGSGDPRRSQDEGGGMGVGALGAGLLTPPPGRPKVSSPRPPPVSPHEPKSDLRGFEWYYYQHLLERSALVFSGHGESVIDAAFTAEGPLVTLDQKGQVRRWDVDSQHEDAASHRDLPGGPGTQIRVLSPDGRLAALAEVEKVHVVDTSTGKERFQIDSSNKQPRRLIFSGDGDRLVIVDDKIRWLGAASGDVIASLDQKFDRMESLALSADGLTLAVVGHARSGRLTSTFRLDPAAKKVTPLAKDFGRSGTLNASALTPDGGRIAVGAKLDGELFVFDAATGRLIAQHGSAHASPIAAMAFGCDGTRLATADAEGTIKIWEDAQRLNSNSAALLTLKGHQGAIHRVDFSRDGKRLVTASADKTARVWDLENSGAAIRPLERAGSSLVVRFSPDGPLIAVATGRSVRLWDAATGRLVRELPPAEKGQVSSVAFSPTDHHLLAVGYGGQEGVSYVALWDIDVGVELARLPGATDLPGFPGGPNNSVVGALAFSPDGKYLVAGFGSKHMLMGGGFRTPLKVWDVGTRRLIRRLDGHTNYCVSLDFSRDGTLLASGSRDGTAILWSTATWKATRTLQNPEKDTQYSRGGRGMVEGVAFSPDGKTLALASRERSVQLWDVATGTILETLKGHSSAVLAVVFSPDGRTLASGGTDQTVRLWNVETRRELMQLDPGGVVLGGVDALAFSSDGRQLLAGGGSTAFWSTTPIVWNDPGRAAEELRRLLHSNADFPGRIRMLSENLRLHEALARLDARDRRVQAALAATQANWQAARKAWPEAVAAFDRLVAADPSGAGAWLRTPGLLRLATALVHQDRPAVAARLLHGGAKRRTEDGLPTAVDKVGPGFAHSAANGAVRVTELEPEYPGSRGGLRPGDTIVKVNDTELTRESIPKLGKLLAGDAGTKVRLTVRHTGSDKPEVIELTRERFVKDPATGGQLYPLRAAIEERLGKEPRNAGLLELRAELAGQWSDAKAQVADYTAAIEALTQQKSAAPVADLQRLHRRRGDAYVAGGEWQQAVDDYERGITAGTTDEAILANQALARANAWLEREEAAVWTVLKPIEAKSELGATLSIRPDNSILAGGDNPKKDRYRVVLAVPKDGDLLAVRLEALTHPSLPGNGPGRGPGGMFNQGEWQVTAISKDGKTRTRVPFQKVWVDDVNRQYPINVSGHWNIWNDDWGSGIDRVAIWALTDPVRLTAGMTMTVEMHSNTSSDVSDNLGRFRIAVSANPQAIEKEAQQASFRRRPGTTAPWVRLAAVDLLKGDQPAIDQLVERRPNLAGPIGDLFAHDKDWPRALALYSKGITENTTDSDLLAKRARAHEALKNWDAAAADWSRAATPDPDGARLLAEFARRLVAGGQVPLAKAQFEKSEGLYARSLHADPENDVLAAELAQLLLDKEANAKPTRWAVLEPSEMKSKGGATLSKLPDESILASGKNTLGDAYTIVARTQLTRVSAIRLEALTHESLPNQGPGRDEQRDRGNFDMVNFTITAHIPGEQPRPIEVSRVAADYHLILTTSHWNIGLGGSRPHTAVYLARQPVDCKDGTRLEVRMEFSTNAEWPLQNLGRFRLSVSGDPAAFEAERTRLDIKKLADPWTELGVAYAVNGRNDEALPYFSRALQQAKGSQASTPIFEEPDGTVYPTNRGDYEARKEARKPIVELASRFDGTLSALIERQPDDPQLQLALARSLVERGKQHLAEKQPAKAQAELEQSRAMIARLRGEPRWSVLTPTEMKSDLGARMDLQKDGSIFVHQSGSARNETYTIVFPSPMKGIKGLRLEALADPRLPNGGPGWIGDFVLSELTLQAAPAGSPGHPRAIALRNASADFNEGAGMTVGNAIDGHGVSGWAIWPEFNEDHTALFELAEEVGDGQGSRLTVGLRQNWPKPGYLLGRFRLSVTDDTTTLKATRIRLDLKDREVADLYIALGKAHAQQGHTDEAVASFAEALPLAADRAGIAKLIAEAATLAGVLEKLAERAAGDARFQAELARHSAEHGNVPAADAARAKARALLEEKLAKEPENTALAAELADLLMIDTTAWTVLKPAERKSDSGVALTVKDDRSILVRGKFTATDVYSVDFREVPKDVHAVRLEALRDDTLPQGGPGTYTNGLFVLSEFKAFRLDEKPDSPPKPIPLQSACATFEEHPAQQSLDAVPQGGWSISGGQQQAQSAYFSVGRDPKLPASDRLRILLGFSHIPADGSPMTLGCFRLSVSVDAGTFDREKDRVAAMKITDPWAKLAAAYHLIADQPALDKLVERHPAAEAGIGDLYASQQDWKRALAEYDRAITAGSQEARTFAARAEAHEKLEQWELAAADWGNADRHAVDKRERYGNPSKPYLERRTWIWGRLQQYKKKLQDCNDLLKPERVGDDPWIFVLRGEAYDGLRQWQKARTDYDRAIQLSTPADRRTFHFYRALHFAAQGQWKPAADDLHQAYPKPTDFRDGSLPRTEWWAIRDAALLYALAGDVESYDTAVAEWYRKPSAETPKPDDSRWTVLTMLLVPEMITNANRPRLLELAGKMDAYWRPRLTAAIQYRSGDFRKAAEFFDANDPGPQFLFLAAMTYQKLGKPDRAKQRLDEGNGWIREQREKDPGAGVPRPLVWQDWAHVLTLQYEASELIHGPGSAPDKLPERAVGEARFQAMLARHLAERGHAEAASAARARATALYAEALAKEPENAALAADLFSAYLSAGLTREAIPHLAKASASNPKDTNLSLKVAALQAWFGQEKELAATRKRIQAFAKDTTDVATAERAARACSILPSTDKADLEAALVIGRLAVKLENGLEWWNRLALGVAEYRSGNDADAEKDLRAAAEAVENVPDHAPFVTGVSSFFRAMSLFRLGKKDEARKLAIQAAARMKPLPADEQNPLTAGVTENDLIVWLAYKEAKAMIHLDAAPAAPVQTKAK